MTMPSRIMHIQARDGVTTRPVWAQIHAWVQSTPNYDANDEDAINPAQNIRTAQCDIRGGTAEVGECLIDTKGELWAITGVQPADSRYASSVRLEIQQPMVVMYAPDG